MNSDLIPPRENSTTNWTTSDINYNNVNTTETSTLFTNFSKPSTAVTTNTSEDLIWTVPTILGIICFLLAVAFIVFFVIKNCEICVLRVVYNYCMCCGTSAEADDKTQLHYSELKGKESRKDEIEALNVKGKENK